MVEKYGIGTRHVTNEGYEVEVVEKIENDRRRRIRFDNGYEVWVFMHNIKSGEVKNPYHPSVFGVGYFGIGDYVAAIKGKHTTEYAAWKDMIRRCYDDKFQQRWTTYVGTTICKEWHNFQNFARWHEENYPSVVGIKFHLDKDLLQSDIENKIYSPDTCLFLPHNVNRFLANKQSNNTSGYIGVCWHKTKKKWVAQITLFEEGKTKHLGIFSTPEDASLVYQEARAIESEKVKEYLRSLNYLPEEVINSLK